MNKSFKPIVLLSVSFFFTAVLLYFFDDKISNTCAANTYVPYTIWSFVVLGFLFGITCYIFLWEIGKLQNENSLLKNDLQLCSDSLNNVQLNLDDAVEKKTFAKSVINASLNREIAERIQAESEGIRLRKRLHAILNSAGDGIFGIDTDGRVTFVNKKAIALLGWTEEELIGTSHHDLVHHTHKHGGPFPVEDCPIYMAYKDGQVHFETNDVFWTKSGTSFAVEYTSTPLMDNQNLTGAVVVFKDISKSKKLEKQLELIVNSAGEGIFGLDVDGEVTFMNKAASIMLGWEQEELLGKSHHHLVHHTHADGSPYHEKDCPIYMACKDGQVHFKSDDVFWRKDGTNFAVEYNSTPIVEGRQLTGAVVVFRDLTTFS